MFKAKIWTKDLPKDSNFICEHAKDNILAFTLPVQREPQSKENTPMVPCIGWHISGATYAIPMQTDSQQPDLEICTAYDCQIVELKSQT